MVLVATVTKKSITMVQDKLWNITMNLTMTEDEIGGVNEVINKDYSAKYRPDDVLSTGRLPFVALMQADIDAYKSEQAIFKKEQLATLVTNVQEELRV